MYTSIFLCLSLTCDKSTRKYLQEEKCYLDAGKVTVLLRLLEGYAQQGRKVLVFSQASQPHLQKNVSGLMGNIVHADSGYPAGHSQAEGYQVSTADRFDRCRRATIARRRVYRGRVYPRFPALYKSWGDGNQSDSSECRDHVSRGDCQRWHL